MAWTRRRSYVGADLEFAARAYSRSLVTYSVGADSKLVPDLATDTGPDVRRRQDVEVHTRRHR